MIIDPRWPRTPTIRADPVTMPIEYDAESGVITFDLAELRRGRSLRRWKARPWWSMAPRRSPPSMAMTADDYSAEAALEVLRKP